MYYISHEESSYWRSHCDMLYNTVESVLCKLMAQYTILLSVTNTYQFMDLMQHFTNFSTGKIFLFLQKTIGDTLIYFPEIFMPVSEDLVLQSLVLT